MTPAATPAQDPSVRAAGKRLPARLSGSGASACTESDVQPADQAGTLICAVLGGCG